MVGVEPSTLRSWEKAIPALQPKTTRGNVRQYRKEDIEMVKLIYNLVKVRGFHLQAAYKMIKADRGAVETRAKVQGLLLSVKAELEAIKAELDNL